MSLLRFRVPVASICRSFSTTSIIFSGHNKWSKIKHKKGANDAQKGAIYSKAYRDIVLAVRNGGNADPDLNAALAVVLKKVKAQGVPKENVENALKKVRGLKDKGGDQQLTYELLGPGSVSLIVECVTDNTNRTLKMMQICMKAYGARFANVSYLFHRRGRVEVAIDKGDDAEVEQVIEAALEAGAEDFEQNETEDSLEIEFLCAPNAVTRLIEAVTAPGMSRELINSELIYAPLESCDPPEDEETQTHLSDLIEKLESSDDVLNVWTSVDG
ncbi:DUF28-domain-containing protein [Sparassis latifolia]|uniref:Probable transcriptional regulatory protein n=1 Tax=Sparassis crispa TaxID=139825 RepID=A0A401GJY0_9APHY|nr:Probable transcriptional regulatory protein [Sparassis crispa]GBE82454.1 Probable transcriptional regulatory protein [Sparassis crispa]